MAVDGDRLVIRPASRLTDPMREALRQFKVELLALLASKGRAVSGAGQAEHKTDRPHQLSLPAAERCHAGGWDEPEIERYTARVTLFIRRGIGATDADDLAEALTLRDREGDDMRLCLECSQLNWRGAGMWQCRSAQAASVSPEIGSDFVALPQRCTAWRAMDGSHQTSRT